MLEAIPPRIEQLGEEAPRISRRIYDLMRGIQLTGNRSTHHPNEVVEDDAIDSMRELSEVVLWYFAEFLPSLGKLQQSSPPKLPLVNVNSPAAGARWQVGNRYEIAWTVTSSEAASDVVAIEIELWSNETKLVTLAGGANPLPGNVRNFGWTVPATTPPESTYRLKVIARDSLGRCGDAFSSGHLTIAMPRTSEPAVEIGTKSVAKPLTGVAEAALQAEPKVEPTARTDPSPQAPPPGIKIISPSAGETWRKGGTHLVAWTSSPSANAPIEKIAITLARGEKSVLILPGEKQYLPGDATSYKLAVPNKLDSPPAAADYQIKVSAWRRDDPTPASAISPLFRIRSSWQNALGMWLGISGYAVVGSFVLFGLAAAVHDLFALLTSSEWNRIPTLSDLLSRVMMTIVGGVFTGGVMFFPFLFLPAAVLGSFWGFTQYFQGTKVEAIGIKLAVLTGLLACLVAAGVAIWVLFGGGPFRGVP